MAMDDERFGRRTGARLSAVTLDRLSVAFLAATLLACGSRSELQAESSPSDAANYADVSDTDASEAHDLSCAAAGGQCLVGIGGVPQCAEIGRQDCGGFSPGVPTFCCLRQ